MAKIEAKEKGKLRASSISQPAKVTRTNIKKRACLNTLPGNSKLPFSIVQKLKIPSFIAKLEARYWKSEKLLVESSYFEETTRVNDKHEQFLAVLIGAMKKIVSSREVDAKFTTYCAALIQQFSCDNSKNLLFKKFRREQREINIKENEEEANMEAKLTSRILTTIESVKYRDHTQEKLDALFEEEIGDNDKESVASGGITGEQETQFNFDSGDDVSDELGNPFMLAEEHPSLQVVKENNLYKFQAPSNNIISPHKPIIQLTDLSVLKTYFDICISTSVNHASNETRLEHESLMAQQKEYFHLKAMSDEVYDTLQSNLTEMFDKIVKLPTNKAFYESIKYAMFDFLLNLKQPEPYNNNDERSIYCKVFIPLVISLV